MKNVLRRIATILLCLIIAWTIVPPPLAMAAEPTVDNPVLFTVRGSIVSGAVRYNIFVDGVFNQSYQSFNITYPKELQINFPSGLAAAPGVSGSYTYTYSSTASGATVTATFILKTGTRSAVLLRQDLESIYFTLVAPPDGFPPENSKVSIQASARKVTAFQDENGYVHYYTFVASTNTNWLQAYNNAKESYMQDPRYPDDPSRRLRGYLATITSQEEQDKIYYDIATQCGWLGGTRILQKNPPSASDTASASPILDSSSLPAVANQFNDNFRHNTGTATTATNTTYWYWACGPEAGQIFYTRARASESGARTPNPATETSSNIPAGFTGWSYYSFWSSGEPNNSDGSGRDGGKGGEYVLQFAWSNSPNWNDYSHANQNSIAGYYIEYGGYPGDPKANELGGSDVSTSSEVELVMPIIIQYRSTVIGETATNRQISAIGISYDRIITYETYLPYTAVRNTPPAAANIPGYTAYGYRFTGVLEDQARLTTNATGDVSGFHSTSTQRIVFLYKPNEYSVTFDANYPGWNSASVSPGSKTVQYDSPYRALASATRPGYTRTGWYRTQLDAALGINPVTPATIVSTMGNHTLYAGWTENAFYTVHYDLNDSVSEPAVPGSIADRTAISWTQSGLLPASPPTREGHVFTGWDVSINGTRQGVTSSDTYGSLAANDSELSITLKAQWRDARYIWVIYHLNDAHLPVELLDAQYDVTSELVHLPPATRPGYTYNGWKVVDDGSGHPGGVYDDTHGVSYADIAAEDAKFIVIEVQWIPKTYTLSYDMNDSGPHPYGTPITGSIWEQNGLVPPAVVGNPTWPGYLFMGWNTQPNGEGRTANVGSTYAQLVGGDDTISGITLYAQWQAERAYFVRFDTNGGLPSSIPDDTAVHLGSSNLLPATNPTPPVGYEFSGWTVTFNGSKSGVTNADTFSDLADDPNLGFIILQAQYSPKKNFVVYYNLNGTTQSGYPTRKPAAVSPDGEIVWTQNNLLPNVDPVWANHTFLGWNTAANGSGIPATNADTYGVLAAGDDSSASLTLYAQWSLNTVYTVRYELNGGTGSVPNVTLQTSDPVPVTPEPTPPVGYVFDHWIVADNGYGTATNVTVTGAQTFAQLVYGLGTVASPYRNYIVVRAVYAVKNDFVVNYDWNFGDSPTIDTITAVRWTDSGFTPHSATQHGKSLLGWTTDQQGLGSYVLPATQYKTLANNDDTDTSVTLYAQWDDAHFIVRYDLNGIDLPEGSTDYNQRTVGFDDADLLPPPPDRIGYRLAGWNVSENGFTQGVTAMDSYRDLANVGAPYITLQAQWAPKDYIVHYDTNGGTPAIPSTLAGDKRWWSDNLLPSTSPSIPGYSLVGWRLAKIGNIEIPHGTWVSNLITYGDLAWYEDMDWDNITLEAQYEELSDVTITYAPKTLASNGLTPQDDDYGGTVSPTHEDAAPVTGTPSSVASPHAGYGFVGWYRAIDTAFTSNLSATTTFTPPRDSDNLNTPGQYVALFKELPNVTISYTTRNLNTSDLNAGGSLNATSEACAPATGTATGSVATAADGYRLVGWFVSGANYVSDTPLSTDAAFVPPKTSGAYEAKTYVAVFIENDSVLISYTTYNLNISDPHPGGSVSETAQILAPVTGTAEGSVATAAHGYHLVGWYVSGSDYATATALATTANFTPSKTMAGVYEAEIYVAVFAEDSDITINYTTHNLNSSDVHPGGTLSSSSQTLAPASGTAVGSVATASSGYHLVGWYVSGSDYSSATALSSSGSFAPSQTSGVYEAKTYVAVFAENEDVTINYGATSGGQVTTTSESLAPATGTASGSTAQAHAYYDFVGWYDASDTGFTHMLSSDAHFVPSKTDDAHVAGSYVARFAEKGNVVIGYIASPGGSVSLASDSVPPLSGTPYGSTATAAPGYQFAGWYLNTALISTNAHIVPEKTGSVYVAATYIAMFAELIPVNAGYRVEHYLEGSATPCETEELNGIIRNTVTAIPKTGYVGYSYDPTDPREVKTGTVAENGSLTLRLYYIANQHDIRYEINGINPAGAPSVPATAAAAYGSTQMVEGDPACSGYLFSGWYTTDCVVQPDGSFVMPDTQVTFTGSWAPFNAGSGDIEATYRVEHYLEGSATPYETIVLRGRAGSLAEAFPKTGYVGYLYDDTHGSNVTSGIMQADGSLTLELHYARRQHEVRYLVEGDIPPGAPDVPDTTVVPFGTSVFVEGSPVFAGYTFSLWRTSDSPVLNGELIMPDRDVVFVGTWTKNPMMLTVLFVDWDGTLLKTEYVPYGWDATQPHIGMTREGYTPMGWDIGFTNVTQNLTVTMRYSQNAGSGLTPGSGSGGNSAYGQGIPYTGDRHLMTWMIVTLAFMLGILCIWAGSTRRLPRETR